MKKNEFLNDLEDILQREEPCNENDILDSYTEWDSLSKMALMAYFQKNFKLHISLNDLKNMEKVSDLIKLSGANISD